MTFTPGPIALLQGLTVNRNRPELESLAAEPDAERFVWRVLPHAARSFAASIVMLPTADARAAAVAYLYCRMLDTYEDLWPDPATRCEELNGFAARFDRRPLAEPTPIRADLARDDRDRVHLLLIDRCAQVDAVFTTLPVAVQERIGELVRLMSDGMQWSTDAFSRQGGVLLDEEQLTLYCRNVIGHPAVFVVDLIGEREIPAQAREDAYLVSEMIQLANVSRDIETDLARGVGYHPALLPHLGSNGYDGDPREVVREVRREYIALALGRAGAYRRLVEGLGLGRRAGVRIAAVLMLLFTDLHYRGCAASTGIPPWPGARGRLGVVAKSLPALASSRWASHLLRSVEVDFLEVAGGMRTQLA